MLYKGFHKRSDRDYIGDRYIYIYVYIYMGLHKGLHGGYIGLM